MTDILDERRRGLEEEYFRRKDRESLEKLRAANREAARARGEEAATMQCPRCNGRLHEVSYDEVKIDRCDKCSGFWLDAGELERIVGEESAPGRWLRVFWPGRADERTEGER